MELGKSFDYALSIKGFRSQDYIKLMDWQAESAQNRFQATGHGGLTRRKRAAFQGLQSQLQHEQSRY